MQIKMAIKLSLEDLVIFSSDEAKEIARLRKELKDTQDALEVLKKAIGILGK